MKKLNLIIISILIIAGFGCEDKYTRIYEANSPVYMSFSELRASIQQSTARVLKNPGKMYFKDGYIFIVEDLEGIHVVDNQDPANPEIKSFIEIPGAKDIAIKGDILYADSYVDLVVLDISDLTSITEVSRKQGVFPYMLPEVSNELPIAQIDETKGVVIGWEVKTVEEEVQNYHYWDGRWLESGGFFDTSSSNSMSGVSSSGFGIGGSMARFGLYDDYLYVVDMNRMHVFDVSVANSPEEGQSFNAGWNVETMFISGDKMFLGTQNGMIIYDLATPFAPAYISTFWHVTTCDPVVVQDTLAYVTLRGGNNCGSNVNELDVLSINDIENPTLLKRYQMEEPYGLGIDGDVLFVCDEGLKVYDASDPLAISSNMIAHYEQINAYDVIPINGVLLMIGSDGFYQYNYDDLNNIYLLSTIEVSDVQN